MDTGKRPSFIEAFKFWLKLGFISFGGPSGQIAIMHTELVERRKWISEERFLHALNFCMLLPGPEAQQLAAYCGWLLHRTRGGIVAGTLFFLPSAVLLWVLSYIYMAFGKVPEIEAVFDGLKSAVLAIVIVAVIRIGTKALKTKAKWLIALVAFIGIYFLKLPFPLIVFSAAVIGWLMGKLGKTEPTQEASRLLKESEPAVPAWKILVFGVLIWAAPVVGLSWMFGMDHTVVQEGLFFSKASMVTFGGAYAVLPYVGQHAVDVHWMTSGQMMDGLGLAETTPGPLVMVLQFVGFVGAWQNPGHLSPLMAATMGSFITSWVTFVPCFIWIFLGAPHVERLRGHAGWSAALSAVTAAVVGVILNLAIWFGVHVIVPDNQPVNWFGLAVAVVAFVGMYRFKWEVVPVVLGAGVLGWVKLLVS
ncbi:chromate efflux transporter [Verrucomicrobia bacterium]|nr:chromate efflux transporter [Verrucomicrobiota bacterium]MDB4459158.1 chromate efflux transporter [bacterium]